MNKFEENANILQTLYRKVSTQLERMEKRVQSGTSGAGIEEVRERVAMLMKTISNLYEMEWRLAALEVAHSSLSERTSKNELRTHALNAVGHAVGRS